jgi:hypothetical protein
MLASACPYMSPKRPGGPTPLHLPQHPHPPVHQPAAAEALCWRGCYDVWQAPGPTAHCRRRLLPPGLGGGGRGGVGVGVEAHKPVELGVWAAEERGKALARHNRGASIQPSSCSGRLRTARHALGQPHTTQPQAPTHLTLGMCPPAPRGPTPGGCSRQPVRGAGRLGSTPRRAQRSARSSWAGGAPPPPPRRCALRRRPPPPGTPAAGPTPAARQRRRAPAPPPPLVPQTPSWPAGGATPALPAGSRHRSPTP